MKKSISLLLLSLLMIAPGCQKTKEVVNEYNIVPKPNQILPQEGRFELNSKVCLVVPSDAPEVKSIADSLAGQLKLTAGISLKEAESADGKSAICFVVQEGMPKEGYKLSVTPSLITLTASQPNGFFYGVQTLYQLLPPAIYGKQLDKKADWSVPAVEIEDSPRFVHRGLMLDVCRHYVPIDYIHKFIDLLAMNKMNVFHWHLTNDQGWRIEIKKYPKLTEIGAFRDSSEINHFGSDVYDGKRHGGFYTQEDLKEIVDYAAKRHITIIPEVSMPGHASAAIASYPWLGTSGKQIKVPGKFGVHYEVFNVADPDVMKFLDEVTDEVIAIFPGSVFHIGGDEVKYDQWKNSPAIRAYMTKHNLKTPAELQVYFTNEISNMLAAKGKRMMGWNEITGDKLHEYQSDADTEGVKQELASGTIVHFWKGDTALIRKTIEKGYDVVNSYHEYTYLDYSYESIPMEKAYSFNPVPEGLTDDQKSKVLGLGCQMWGEFIPTVESMNLKVYPRLAAYAETGWTDASNKDYQRFLDKLNSFLQKWKTEGITCGPVQ